MTIPEVATLASATAVATIARGGAFAAPIFAAKAAAATTTAPETEFGFAKQLNRKWYDVPEPLRFFVSGNLGNICFFGIERIVHIYLSQLKSPPPFVQKQTDSIAFFLSYILQIVTQHLLHALLVYGLDTIDTREKYLRTLFGQSGAYFVALIGSTILNLWLRRTGMSKDLAFTTTLVVFACVNYFVIGWIVHRTVDAPVVQDVSASKKKNDKKKETPKKKQQKAAPNKQNKQKPSKEKASKVTKRFGRGGAQDVKPWPTESTFGTNPSCSMRGFVLRAGEPVYCLQTNSVSLANYPVDLCQ